ncbi:MAG TPA: hypothetical protein VFA85_10515 [Terriglobales bacterium]|nr:hypothetical protein [Terriglobales bacterium]
MSVEIRFSRRSWVVVLLSFSGIAFYFLLVSVQYLAAYLSDGPTERRLRWAVKLDPFNAEYRDHLGRFDLLARQSPASALPSLEAATRLDPYRAGYWLDRANVEELIGSLGSERVSLGNTVAADPRSANTAWEVANLYLAQGAVDDALNQYRRVMENDPHLTPTAIQICWKIRPDIDLLLQNVVPANAYQAFLSYLVSENQSAASAKVWERIVSLRQPVERRFLFDYLRHLFAVGEALQAARVWQQAAALSGLAAYEPSDDNLLVNGDFRLDVTNGGFDWTYRKTSGVSLALDPINGHSGARSLRLFFEGPGISDAGIRQIVFVDPNTRYEFSGYYKAQEMDGAGGVRFCFQDLYNGTPIFMSADLSDTESWTPARGAFTTGPDTHLVTLQIARVPAGSPIRGKLWVDDLKLITASHLAALHEEQP